MKSEETQGGWADTSAMAAPALLGAAAGMLLGELMHTNARRGVALGLLGLGIAALAPKATYSIIDKVNGPRSARGSRRRLERIREAGVSDEFGFVDEELEEHGVI